MPQEFLVDRMRDLFLATATELSIRLRAEGYYAPTAAQIAVMSQIPPGGIRVVDLAKLSGVTKQAIHQMAEQLIAAAVLERVADPRDGRAKLLRPTRYALRAYAVSRRILAEIHSDWRRALGERAYTNLEISLAKLKAAAENAPSLRGRRPAGASRGARRRPPRASLPGRGG